jgi:hypothetical protein
MNCNKICLQNSKRPVKLSDIIENDQINYMTYELGLTSECIFHHINVNYYEEYNCSILTGDSVCNSCNDIDNLVFDHRTYLFHSMPFVHTIITSNDSEQSTPAIILNLIFIDEKWLIIAYGMIMNNLLFYNGNTFEDIFIQSWGFNRLSLLPKNQCHVFMKSIKAIIENSANEFVYVMSYYKQDQVCRINKHLKILFPSKRENIQLRFSYPSIELLEEKEIWKVISNLKKRTSIKKRTKRFSVISQFTSSTFKKFSLLISSTDLRSVINNSTYDFSDIINSKLISYQS